MRHQLRLLLLSVAAVVLIVLSAFFTDWFVIHVGSLHDVQIDLRRVRVCAPECYVHDVSMLNGLYPSLATLAFWSAMPLFVVIVTQTGAKLLSGAAYQFLVRIGTGLGAVTFFSAFGAGYLVGADAASIAGFQLFTVDRGFGPLCMVLGSLAGMIAIRYSMIDSTADDVGEYIPVVIPKPGDSKESTRVPVTPLSLNKLPTPPAGAGPALRNKSPTQQPAIARPGFAGPRSTAEGGAESIARTTSPQDVRPKPPSQPPPPVAEPRTKAPSQAPLAVDVAARLGGAPIDVAPIAPISVAIRPPLPEPEPIPEDQIPVAPESGLVIRTRPPSVAPPMMPSVASALGVAVPIEPAPPTPQPGVPSPSTEAKPEARRPDMKSASNPALRLPEAKSNSQRIVKVPPPKSSPAIALPPMGTINYAVTTAVISSDGITATRQDGLSKLIAWSAIVGIVARRLPPHPPYDGVTFVDIVSSAGSTMRILPLSEISGHTFTGDHTERARSLVILLAAQALDAKLDSATKVFANGTSKAAQLRDEQTLATHDVKLA